MKKFLLFSVLSILLSVFYTVNAQECCFWLENADPDQPTDLYSLNPMSTSLNETQYYYFKFENNCLLQPNDKVSIDWSFEVNGVKVDALTAGQFGVEIEMKNPMAQSLSNDGYVPSGQLLSGQGLLSVLGCPNNTDYPGGLGGPHPNSYCTNTPMFSYFAQGQNNNLYNFLYVHFLEYASDNNLIRLKINRKSWGDYKLTFKLILRKNGEEYQNEYRTAEGTTHYYIGGKLAQYDRQIGSFTLEEQTYSTGEAHACSGDTIYVGLDPLGNPYKFVETVYIPDSSKVIEVDVYFYNQSDDCIDFIDSVVHYTLTWSPMPTAPTVEGVTRCGAGDLTFNATHKYDTLYPGTYTITYNWYTDAALTNKVYEGVTYTITGLPTDTTVNLWVTAHILGCEGDAVHVQGTVYRIPVITLTNPANLCPENGTKGVVATVAQLYTPFSVTAVWTDATGTGVDGSGTDYKLYANVAVTDECNKEYTYSIQVTDDNSGCTATATSSFILNDTENPTFTPPAATTVYRDSVCDYDISLAVTGQPTNLADNCSLLSDLVVTHNDAAPVQIPGACASNVTITRTWTVTDHCGNAATAEQVITILDNIAPTFTVPADIVVYRKADCTVDTIPTATGVPTNLADNCTTNEADFEVSYVDATAPSTTCPSNITITRTWTVKDQCGNATSKDQVITVEDTIKPTFTLPADITVYRKANCSVDTSITTTGEPTNFADNCTTSAADFQVTYADVTTPSTTCPSNITIERTWTVTDQCGNAATGVQTITVEDTIKPTFTLPADITVYREADCTVDTSTASTGLPYNFADNCTTNAADFGYTYVDTITASTTCPSNITIERTWTVMDQCGNAATGVQTITVEDNTKPTFTLPADTTLYRDATCAVDTTTTSTGVPTDLADNCTTNALDFEITYADNITVSTTCASNITIERTWTVKDQCGNAATGVQTIIVEDNTKPTFTLPADTTLYRDATCTVDTTTTSTGVPTNFADNCTANEADFTVSYVDEIQTNACPSNITIERTWTVKDQCGNAATGVQTITVEDTTKPTFTPPADIAICKNGSNVYNADTSITGVPTGFNDNCPGALVLTFVDDINSGSATEVGTIMRTFTLTDACGNAATHVQTITLNPAPDATITSDSVSFCLYGTPVPVTITLTPDDTSLYTFSITEPNLPVNATTSTITVNIINPGDYTFTGVVTNKATGCSSDAVVANVEALLYPDFDIDTIQHKIGCRNDSIPLNAIIRVTANPSYTYTITPSADFDPVTYTFSNLLLQTYTITATHTNGCTYSRDYEVQLDPDYLPVAQLKLNGEDKDIAVCWSTGLTIPTLVQDLNNISGHEYLFSIIVPTGVIAHGSNYIQITAPGAYEIGGSVFNKVTGCGDTTWHWVYANEIPAIEVTQDVQPCLDESITLVVDATPDLVDTAHFYSYVWKIPALSGDTLSRIDTFTHVMDATTTFELSVTANYNYSGIDAEGNFYAIPLQCSKDTTFTIIPHPTPTFTLQKTGSVHHCNSDTLGKIMIDSGWDVTNTWTAQLLPSGTPFAVTAQEFEVNEGGNYRVTALSVNGCTYTQEVFVDSLYVGFDAVLHASTDSLLSFVDYSANLKFCWTTGDTIWHEIRYSNNPTFSYQYTINTPLGISQQNSQSSIVNAPGDYLLSGYVVNITTGCRSKTDSLYVYAVENPVYTVSPDQEICYGDSVKIGVSYTDTTYKVSWNGTGLSATTDSVTITQSMYGILSPYTATVTVSNEHDSLTCTVSKDVKININPIPVFGTTTVDSVTCFGGSNGKITLNVTGTPPFSYTWSTTPPDTVNPLDNLTAGSYIVTVTDGNGCQAVSTSIEVGEPTEIKESSKTITHVNCYGNSTGAISFVANGGTPPYTYSINDTTYVSPGDFNSLPAGTYTIYVKDAKDCKKSFAGIEVTQPDYPVTATLTPTNPGCHGDSTGTIIANPIGGTPHLAPHDGYNYSWSNGKATRQITGLPAGWYTVTVTDSLGCQFVDSVELVAPSPITVKTRIVTDVLCYGDNTGKIVFTAEGGTPGTPPNEYTYILRNQTLGVYIDTNNTGTFENLYAAQYRITVIDSNNCFSYFANKLKVNEPTAALALSIATDTVHVNCHSGATGAASVVVTGGTYPYYYAWSHTHADSTATGLIAGTYKVTVTDANGCIDSVEVIIRQLEEIKLIDASTVIDTVTCFGTNTGGITVVAQGGSGIFEYSIDGGGTYQPSGTFTNLYGDSTYTITVRDSIHPSCTKVFTGFYVPQPTKLTLDPAVITDSIKCHGGFAKVQITATGGNGGYTYTLQGHSSNNTGTFINVLAGEYKYSVVDSKGCEDTSTVKLNIPQPTQLQINTAEITDSILCHGGKANVTITATNGTPPYRYVLGTDTNTTGLFEVFAGTYTYAVIDANLCVEAPAATIVVPNPDTLYLTSASATTIACYGQFATVTITATGGTGAHIYTLEGHGNSTTGIFSNIPAGVYGYSVVDQKGCKDTSSTSLVITQPDTLIATAAVTDTIKCHGNNGEITIYATGGTRPYQFSFNANPLVNDSTFAASAGTYPYYVQDANLCITVVDSIKIEQPEPIVVTTDTTHVKCNGGNDGSLVITSVTGGVGPYSYKWGDGSTDTTITGLSAGTYHVTVTDYNNCESPHSYLVKQPNEITIDLTPTTATTCIYDTTKVFATVAEGTPGYTYEWTLDGDTTVIATTDTIYVTPGKYHITVTDNAGCEKVDSITIIHHPVPTITSDEQPQHCDSTAFTVTATSTLPGNWTAQLYSGVNSVEPITAIANNSLTCQLTVPNTYKDTTLYILFTFVDVASGCVFTHTTDTIKISGEPRLRIYRLAQEDNYVTIDQNDPTEFHFMVENSCSADKDIRLAIDYQIYHNDTLIGTFSEYFSASTSMNFQMGIEGTGWPANSYQPIDYSLNLVSSHFPYAASDGAVFGSYQFDYFNLRFFENREGTITLDYLKVPGEYVIDFQLVSHYTDASMAVPHGSPVGVFMTGGRVGGNHFYTGSYYTKVWSTNTMNITVNPIASPAPFVPSTFERDVTVDPASLTVEMRIYPNPTTPSEEVKIELSNLSSTGVLTIANINGLVLEQYQLKDISKNHDLVLKVNNYAPGIYFVTYRSKEGLVTKKLVIQSR